MSKKIKFKKTEKIEKLTNRFGTYDLHRPDNATHWVAVSGKNHEDQMMPYYKLQSNSKFTKLITERGNSKSGEGLHC